MMPRQEYETIKSPELSPGEVADRLENWARAEGNPAINAVVYLLKASEIAESWPGITKHLDFELYTDPEDPDPVPYEVVRILDWGRLHNAIPVHRVGKSALALFVFARMLGDRSYVENFSDLIEGMEPGTQRLVHTALGVYVGRRPSNPWDRED